MAPDEYMDDFLVWLADHAEYHGLAERAFAENDSAAWRRLDAAAAQFLEERDGRPGTHQEATLQDQTASELIRELEVRWLQGELQY